MRTAYIAQTGATLRREGNLLHVYVGQKREAELPVYDLQQLVIMGNVVLTPRAIDLLLERGIDTVLLTLHGRYRGRLVGAGSSNVTLRMAQYARLTNPQFALDTARVIVESKITNQRELLVRYARNAEVGAKVRAGIIAMRASLERVKHASTLDELRGCEGAAAAAYFRAFASLIRNPGFSFDGRNRRPPMDPVNALLSLGYTLMANAVEAAVHVVGLDPFLGALHAVETGRPSMVCDLEEEFRAPLVDALVLAAINQEWIEPQQFEHGAEGEPVVMKPEAVRQMVRLMERRLNKVVRYEPTGQRLSYRSIIEQQARAMARALLRGQTYAPYRAR